MRIISLTSIPPRFAGLGPVLEALLAQGADETHLAIPERYIRFPNWDGDLPKHPQGITVLRCPDFGPATKLIPALQSYADATILYCDDDALYGPGWAKALFSAHTPGQVTAAQSFPAARIGAKNTEAQIAIGANGVVISAADLPGSIAEIPPECLLADDLWFSAMYAYLGLPVMQASGQHKPHYLPNDLVALQIADRAAVYREALTAVQNHLGLWT